MSGILAGTVFQQTVSNELAFKKGLFVQKAHALKIKEGMVIADIGAGNGFEAVGFSSRVGKSGKVYAVDIDQDRTSKLTLELSRQKNNPNLPTLGNIQVILGTPTDPKLPPNSLDAASINLTHHEFSQPKAMDGEIFKALKKGDSW